MAVFLYLAPVYAKSGCCSYHDGVNCAAGPQSNGKVICNDGWRQSSCFYSEMVMCGGYTASEPEPHVETPPPAVVAPPEPKPSPVIKPSPSPVIKPPVSPSPRPSFSPSPAPSVLPSIPSTKPQSENKPTSNPEVKGYETKTKSEPLSVTDWAIFLFLLVFVISVLGLFGLGSYKLLLRIRKIFRRKNNF